MLLFNSIDLHIYTLKKPLYVYPSTNNVDNLAAPNNVTDDLNLNQLFHPSTLCESKF